jgi:hypothetical protein
MTPATARVVTVVRSMERSSNALSDEAVPGAGVSLSEYVTPASPKRASLGNRFVTAPKETPTAGDVDDKLNVSVRGEPALPPVMPGCGNNVCGAGMVNRCFVISRETRGAR